MVYSPNFSVPMLNKEQTGAFDLSKAIQSGFDTYYKPKNMAEQLLQAQLKNKHDSIINQFLPESERARISHTGAETELLGHQSKNYDQNIQSEIQLRNAQKGLYGAQAQAAAQNAALKKSMWDMYSSPEDQASGGQSQGETYSPGSGNAPYADNMRNTLSQQGAPASGISEPFEQINQMHQANQNMPYGINIPQPSRHDLAGKMLFGIDTYGDKQKQAYEQIKDEKNKYSKKSENINTQLGESNKHRQLIDRYNKLMDESILTGPFGSKVKIPTAKRQEIESVTRDMILSGIGELKNAMGSARFSNLDLETATARKPDISWTPEARKEYADRFKSFDNRLNEQAQFNQLASNPKTGISSDMADRLWSAYQKHHPIVADEKTLALNKYKPNNWARYLTPEAINSVKQTGDYNPKDKGLVNNLTKTEQKIAENYSLKDLEKRLAAIRGGKAK